MPKICYNHSLEIQFEKDGFTYDIQDKRYLFHFDRCRIKDGVIDSVKFTGGCNGNLQGISALVKGMKPEEAISRLKGIRCGFKPTSCPDQLAHALEEMIAQ